MLDFVRELFAGRDGEDRQRDVPVARRRASRRPAPGRLVFPAPRQPRQAAVRVRAARNAGERRRGSPQFGFQVACSHRQPRIAATLLSPRPDGSAPRCRMSKRTSGSAGRWMPCSTGWNRRPAPAVQGRDLAVERPSPHPAFLRGHRHHRFSRRHRAPASIADSKGSAGKPARQEGSMRSATPVRPSSTARSDATRRACGRPADRQGDLRVTLDDDDADGQTPVLWYPAATDEDAYIRSAVKIEAGANSALDPHAPPSVTPYVADDLPDLDLASERHASIRSGPSGTRSSSFTACGAPSMTGVASCAAAATGLAALLRRRPDATHGDRPQRARHRPRDGRGLRPP